MVLSSVVTFFVGSLEFVSGPAAETDSAEYRKSWWFQTLPATGSRRPPGNFQKPTKSGEPIGRLMRLKPQQAGNNGRQTPRKSTHSIDRRPGAARCPVELEKMLFSTQANLSEMYERGSNAGCIAHPLWTRSIRW